jgi:hypothetical protein
MSNKQNIEDLFRSGLDDYSINPSEKVWSGINKQMAGPRFEALYRNTFNGFKISPSEQVWRRVAAMVWFNKFIHFTPFSFNIYYLAIITSAVIGTVITVNNNPNLNFVHFDENAINNSIIDTDSTNFINMPFVDDIVNYNSLLTEANLMDSETSNEKENTTSTNPAELNVRTDTKLNNEETNSIVNTVQKSDIAITTSNSTKQETLFAQNTKNTSNIPIENPTDLNNSNTKTTTSSEVIEIATISPVNSSVLNTILPLRLQLRTNTRLSYSPQWNEIADLAFTGLPILSEIVRDTIGYNYLGEPIVVDKSWFTIDAFYSPYLCNYNSELLNSELLTNYNFNSTNNKPGFSYSAGLGFSYTYNKFRFETGINYHKLNENLSANMNVYDTITSHYFDYFENEKWRYDTTMILDLDQYLLGYIVYIPYVDSTLIQYTDSIDVAYPDSVLVDRLFAAKNAYHIIDIPIIAGYQFTYGDFSITPKAGVITGFLTKRTGTAFNIIDGKIHNADLLPTNKIIFDYYAAINLQYRLTKHASLFIEPHLRGNISSIYQQTYAISEKSRKYGIKTGISIIF